MGLLHSTAFASAVAIGAMATTATATTILEGKIEGRYRVESTRPEKDVDFRSRLRFQGTATLEGSEIEAIEIKPGSDFRIIASGSINNEAENETFSFDEDITFDAIDAKKIVGQIFAAVAFIDAYLDNEPGSSNINIVPDGPNKSNFDGEIISTDRPFSQILPDLVAGLEKEIGSDLLSFLPDDYGFADNAHGDFQVSVKIDEIAPVGPAAVPVPASLPLLAGGIFGFAALRRKARKA